MKLDDLTEGAYYSMQGQKMQLVRKGIAYGPSAKPWGVEVRNAAGRLTRMRAQDLDAAWTREHEQRWLARRRSA
jgi:hypothetical protein